MSKHTPGPWKLGYEIRGWEVCTIHQVTPSEDGQTWVYVYPAVCHYGEPEENAANARLIAAAPDLLEALKWAMSRLVYLAEQSDRADEARALIDRAEGKS